MSWRSLFQTPDRVSAVEHQCREILDELKKVTAQLSHLTRRDAQVRALLEREAELEGHQARLIETLSKPGIASHVARAIRRAEVISAPFAHAVVDDLLPADLYSSLIRGLPPIELFGGRPTNKQQLTVPFTLAPTYSQRVWRYLTTVVVPDFIVPAVIERFRAPLDEWLALNWPSVSPASVALHNSDGRIILRRRGYQIPPHRDPKWGFITCILYLARRQDSEAWGTQIFTVESDQDAVGAAPHWVDPSRCRQVGEVAFKANRLFIFLNSFGAHGAHIPDTAEPADLERYIYQFRIAPTVESMSLLKTALPDDRRPFWAGKSTDY